MQKQWMWISLLAVTAGLTPALHADDMSKTAPGQVSVTTNQPATVTVSPTAAPVTDYQAPSAVAPAPVVSAVPAATEEPAASADQNQELEGTVQSVDRRNHALVVQAPDGKNIGISFNNNWHLYRRGEEIQYRDVEPNDVIQARYRS